MNAYILINYHVNVVDHCCFYTENRTLELVDYLLIFKKANELCENMEYFPIHMSEAEENQLKMHINAMYVKLYLK